MSIQPILFLSELDNYPACSNYPFTYHYYVLVNNRKILFTLMLYYNTTYKTYQYTLSSNTYRQDPQEKNKFFSTKQKLLEHVKSIIMKTGFKSWWKNESDQSTESKLTKRQLEIQELNKQIVEENKFILDNTTFDKEFIPTAKQNELIQQLFSKLEQSHYLWLFKQDITNNTLEHKYISAIMSDSKNLNTYNEILISLDRIIQDTNSGIQQLQNYLKTQLN